MSDWISWEEAVEVVARHFPSERAERLLRAAVLRGGVVEVRVEDRGRTTGPLTGRYVPDNPDYPYAKDQSRPYYEIEAVGLRSLKRWLKALTSDAEPAPGSELAADDEGIYRSGAPGRPTSAHLVKAELKRRATAGELCASLASEAEHLSQWLTSQHPNAPGMTKKTISNSCRDAYLSARKQRPK